MDKIICWGGVLRDNRIIFMAYKFLPALGVSFEGGIRVPFHAELQRVHVPGGAAVRIMQGRVFGLEAFVEVSSLGSIRV